MHTGERNNMPLVVHFLNVGQGDCTIIQFPSGRVGIVDIDNLPILDDETNFGDCHSLQARELPAFTIVVGIHAKTLMPGTRAPPTRPRFQAFKDMTKCVEELF